MAKLSQLIALERMLNAYDSINVDDSRIVRLQGKCIGELVDEINAKLTRLLASKTILSCRNVLVAHFETMTKPTYWLKSKLFIDLPKAESKLLRDKIDGMVELLKQLMIKIFDVDIDYAGEFFARLNKQYSKKRTSQYEVWKKKQYRLTMNMLTKFQAEITADMLISGILKYDEDPSGEEMEKVDLDKLRKKVGNSKFFPDGFKEECAKLRRYSYWEGEMFVIDYKLLRKYLFRIFGKLTREQHIALYEYNIQMKQIHEDIQKLEREQETSKDDAFKDKILNDAKAKIQEAAKRAVSSMWADGTLQHKYDHTWIMMTMNETESLPNFGTPTEYLDYMESCGVMDRLPDRSSISKYYDQARGCFPNWTFTGVKEKETIRRNNVGKRFLKLVLRA